MDLKGMLTTTESILNKITFAIKQVKNKFLSTFVLFKNDVTIFAILHYCL